MRAGLALCGLGLVGLAGVPLRDADRPDPLERAQECARLELRAALDAYRADHGRWPGRDPYGFAHEGLLRLQLEGVTDPTGRPLPDGQDGLGPYLPDGVPVEPCSGDARLVLVGADDAGEPGPHDVGAPRGGWSFDPVDGSLEALSLEALSPEAPGSARAPRPHPDR